MRHVVSGGLKAILSISGWTVISKLFYSAYLLGPLIISMLTTNAETSMHLSFFQTVSLAFFFFFMHFFSGFF